jgi:hypothetical protein
MRLRHRLAIASVPGYLFRPLRAGDLEFRAVSEGSHLPIL